MSQIASFYLVKAEHIPRLKDLAKQPVGPVKRSLLGLSFKTGQWHDPFWDFMSKEAHELEHFNWSGSVILSVEEFLRSVHIDLAAYADKELTDYLSEARDSFLPAFTPSNAHQFADAISKLQPTQNMIMDFLETNTDWLEDEPVDGMLDGLAILQSWLRQVEGEQIGLLSIG